MPAPRPVRPAPPRPRVLRRLLLSRRPEDAEALQAWRDAPDAREAIRRVAGGYGLPVGVVLNLNAFYRMLAWPFAFMGVMAALYFAAKGNLGETQVLLASVVVTAAGVGVWEAACIRRNSQRFQAAKRAALLLGAWGDPHAAWYLAQWWTPRPGTRRGGALNREATATLTALLQARASVPFDASTETALYQIVKRAFPRRIARGTPQAGRDGDRAQRVRARRVPDLSPGDHELFLTLMGHFRGAPSASPRYLYTDTRDAVERIAAFGASGSRGEHLRDTAQAILHGERDFHSNARIADFIAAARAGDVDRLAQWLGAGGKDTEDELYTVACTELKTRDVIKAVIGIGILLMLNLPLAAAMVLLTRAGQGAFAFLLVSFFAVLPLLLVSCVSELNRDIRLYYKSRHVLLFLAERGDTRLLERLASEWRPRPHPLRRAWNEQVTVALTYLLNAATQPAPKAGKGKRGATVQSSPGPKDQTAEARLRAMGEALLTSRHNLDLTTAQRLLLLALARYLHQADGDQNRAFLLRAATCLPSTDHPNRQAAREAVQELSPPAALPAILEAAASHRAHRADPDAPRVVFRARSG